MYICRYLQALIMVALASMGKITVLGLCQETSIPHIHKTNYLCSRNPNSNQGIVSAYLHHGRRKKMLPLSNGYLTHPLQKVSQKLTVSLVYVSLQEPIARSFMKHRHPDVLKHLMSSGVLQVQAASGCCGR